MRMNHVDRKQDVDRILETLIYLYTEARRVTKDLARRHGLTGPQLTAVKMLEGFGDLSLSALSARMSARNSTITGLVDRMERDGLVERVRDDADRRIVRIRLTTKGRALARMVPVGSMETFADALRSLDDADRDDLLRILGKLADHVRAEVEREGERKEGP